MPSNPLTSVKDKRLNNTAPYQRKIDINKTLTMYFKHEMPEADIARYFHVSPSGIFQALKPFKEIMKSNAILEAYNSNKSKILDSIEVRMLKELVNEKRLKKATTGNIAYSFDKIATHNRLEKGLSTSNVSYEDINKRIETIDAEIMELEGGEVGESTSNQTDNTPNNSISLPRTKRGKRARK